MSLIPKDIIENLYIKQNLTKEEIESKLDISNYNLSLLLKEYNIKKPRHLINQKIKENNIKNYGVSSPAQLDIIKEQNKLINIEKYGAITYTASKQYKEVMKKPIGRSPISFKEIEQKYPKELIKKLYIENKLSKDKIAKELNISVSIVNKIIKYYNLKRDRYKILSEKLSNPNSKKQSHFQELCKRIPKEDIIKWYVEEDHKYEDAFEHYGITQFAFDKLCKYYGIKKDRRVSSLKRYKINKN